jgi:hypothetical protein
MLLHACGLFLQPDQDGIERRDLPILVCQQLDVELQAAIAPKDFPAHLA